MNKQEKCTDEDELIFTIEDDGEITQHDYMGYQEWLADKQDVGVDVHWIPLEVVQFIEDSSEKNPDNYPKPKPEDLTDEDAEALAFMYHNVGALYVEVLLSYTQFIKEGMRPVTAVYAAMLTWDLEIPGVAA